MGESRRRARAPAAAPRALFVSVLLSLGACYRSHELESGIPITVLTADLNLLQLPSAPPEAARGALVRAERCEDGAVAEARTNAAGVAWIDFGDGIETTCWTLTAVLLGARPTAITLVRVEAPLPSPIVLDQHAGARAFVSPTDLVTVEWTVEGRSDEASGVTIVGKHVDVEGLGGGGFAPIALAGFSTEHERGDLVDDETLFAIEWLDGIPVNATSLSLGPVVGGTVQGSIAFPPLPTSIRRVRLPFHLPRSGAYPFGPLPADEEFWGSGGFVWGTQKGGGLSRIGELVLDYDEANDPPWTVEAIWPDLPWSEILEHEPRLGFVFVREGADGDGVHGFVDGPIAEGSHLEVPPLAPATLIGDALEEVSVGVGGEGHVGFLFLQGASDAFTEYSRYRIYSAPHEPLVLDTWPTLPGGLALDELRLDGEGSIRVTAGVSDPEGNPGWMRLPIERDLGRRVFLDAKSLGASPAP